MELVVKNQNLPDWKEEEGGGRRRKEEGGGKSGSITRSAPAAAAMTCTEKDELNRVQGKFLTLSPKH